LKDTLSAAAADLRQSTLKRRRPADASSVLSREKFHQVKQVNISTSLFVGIQHSSANISIREAATAAATAAAAAFCSTKLISLSHHQLDKDIAMETKELSAKQYTHLGFV